VTKTVSQPKEEVMWKNIGIAAGVSAILIALTEGTKATVRALRKRGNKNPQ